MILMQAVIWYNLPWAAITAGMVALLGAMFWLGYRLGQIALHMERTTKFESEIKNNHLPHIYEALQIIMVHLGLTMRVP